MASLVAQMVKHLPAIQETWVRSLGWEDPLEEGMATHSSILTWRIPTDSAEGLGGGSAQHPLYFCICSLTWWASLIAQLVKNPPAMQKSLQVQFLGQQDPLEKG